MAGQVTRSGTARVGSGARRVLSVCGLHRRSKVAGMAYDVARVRGLHPSLGDGWVHFDAQNGMLMPDSVATTVSTAFRGSMRDDRRPASRRRSAVRPCWTRPARRSPISSTPIRAVWCSVPTARCCSTRWPTHRRRVSGLGYEIVVTRLDDEANIAPWLRAANRYGAKVQVGRGRHRDRRAADLAVGEPDHPGDPPGRDHLGVVDAGHRHRSAGRDEADRTTSAGWWSSTTRRRRPTG